MLRNTASVHNPRGLPGEKGTVSWERVKNELIFSKSSSSTRLRAAVTLGFCSSESRDLRIFLSCSFSVAPLSSTGTRSYVSVSGPRETQRTRWLKGSTGVVRLYFHSESYLGKRQHEVNYIIFQESTSRMSSVTPTLTRTI